MILIYLLILPLILLPVWLLAGWERLPRPVPPPPSSSLSYAIMVPFRNEAGRILPLLESLGELAFPINRYEVWFLDDHSTDTTTQLLDPYLKLNSHWHYMRIQGQGKKAALTQGIHACDAQVILTTDADCNLPADWISSMDHYFSSGEYDLVAGMVSLSPQGIWYTWQAVELAALVGVAGGSIGWHRPTLCNGANLAFQREAFIRVGGYEGNAHLPTGDDEFLLGKIASENVSRIAFNSLTAVITQPTSDFVTYREQRRRWASKWRHHSRIRKWAGPVLALLYVLWVSGGILALFQPEWRGVAGLLSLLKLTADALLIRVVLRAGKSAVAWVKILLAGLVYPFYFIYFAMVVFKRQYEWKGRRYSPTVLK